ncbi:HEAT repeat domain-containing protein [Mucilaginibacter sp. JRF]|uniref:HEAT repeat domain-containing protein n=1 Tax=Mucilaginibacter sp. JRF TaxID=2780088 RepID=UPI00187E9E8C|nr:HEAT repeat domain-containing protein [Mucilaginibacter sp. JRF]MBE9586002.1 HEAT repeat domain-containing protein [Mucilaginibacter sp. JRF]
MAVNKDQIKQELLEVGIAIDSIFDLANTYRPYPEAIAKLLDFLIRGVEDLRIKEGIVRALAVKEAVGIAGPVLLDEYHKTPKEEMLYRWAIGNTISKVITTADVKKVISIVKDRSNCMSRQMFVIALGKFKSEEVENVLISLLDEDEVAPHALAALGKMKSNKAKKRILLLTDHPRSLIRKEALKALKKIS